MGEKLVIRLLGSVVVELDGKPLRELPSRAAEALLIYLVGHDQPIPRDVLAELLWYERSRKQGLTNLRTILSSLRRELQPYLTVTRQSLAFNHGADYWLDVPRFETELTRLLPELPPGPLLPPETAAHLQVALDLYRGNFLEGFALPEGRGFEAWMVIRREQLQRLAIFGLQRLVEHHFAAGNYHQGVVDAEKLLVFDPYNEAGLRRLMRLLIRVGRPLIAVQRYQTFSRLLAEELGIAPDPVTMRLYQRIRRAPTSRVNNLPGHATSFVGRESELRQLKEYLTSPNCRLITLVGPGGIGKTRLALEAAANQQASLLHGVCFVPLAELSSADRLVSVLAGRLGLSVDGADDPKAQLLRALQEREILLLLDNFEQLLSPAEPSGRRATGLISEILAAAPEVKLIVTSRERLNLDVEWLFQVEGLPAPDETEMEQAADYGAVQLFLQSARRVANRFTATARDLSAIVRICRLVDGMPLAIRLAAAWIPTISCAQIAAEIERDLAFLQSSAGDASPRHRSIAVVFNHSWELLTLEEQQIMGRLSVFRDGFGPDAAHEVTGASLPVLASLIDKSWLTLTLDGRYGIHELLRRYAAEKLERRSPEPLAGETGRVRAQHAAYYLRWLQQQQDALAGANQMEALSAIAGEVENLRVAWHWAVDQNRLDLISCSLESLWSFYEIKNWFDEGEAAFAGAVDGLRRQSSARAADQLLATQLLIRQGWFCLRLARFDQARGLLQEGLALAREHGYGLETGRAFHYLALIDDLTGRFADARELFEASLAAYREHGGSHFELGSALGSLGHVLVKLGHFDRARPIIDEGIQHYEATGNPRAIALMYSFLAGFAIQQGDYSAAVPLLRQGLAVQEKIDDLVMIRMSLAWLGEAYEGVGDLQQAGEQFERSLSISRANGDAMGIITAANHLGRVQLALGEHGLAGLNLQDALRMAAAIQFMPILVDALGSVAALLAQTGNAARARDILSLIVDHPAADPQIRKRIAARQAELCGPSAAAETRSVEAGLTLETVVADLLASNRISDGHPVHTSPDVRAFQSR